MRSDLVTFRDRKIKTKKRKQNCEQTTLKISSQIYNLLIWFLQNRKAIPLSFMIGVVLFLPAPYF